MKKDLPNIDQKLLVLYLLDEISQDGRRKVEAWLDSSEENRTHFAALEKVWTATGKIDPASVEFDTNRAWRKMEGLIQSEDSGLVDGQPLKTGGKLRGLLRKKSANRTSDHIIKFSSPAARILTAIAAVLILGAVSVIFTNYLRNRQGPDSVTLASLSVPVQDTLTDGSSIILNANSKLVVPKVFAKETREVELTGEAFFQVKPDPERPFIIDAGLGQVKVLGTSFQVKAYPGSDLEVYVESGRVELSVIDSLSGDTLRTVLKAGERGKIKMYTREIGKPADIGPDELFWANKKLIFEETKLSLVFDLLKKHYDAGIEAKDEAILNCLLSATFTDESIDQILEVIAASFDLTVTRSGEKYIFNGKGCSSEE